MSKSLYGLANTCLIPEPCLVYDKQKKYELIKPPNYKSDERDYFIKSWFEFWEQWRWQPWVNDDESNNVVCKL